MDDVYDSRATIRRGTVVSVDDTGPVQMVTVQTGPGAFHTAEVHQGFGHASVPPADGCTALLFCVGGDPANMIAFIANPATRFGGQAQGESVLYDGAGNRVAISSGGTIQILAATTVEIKAPDVTIVCSGSLTVTAAQVALTAPQVAVTGNLMVTGNIVATGTILP